MYNDYSIGWLFFSEMLWLFYQTLDFFIMDCFRKTLFLRANLLWAILNSVIVSVFFFWFIFSVFGQNLPRNSPILDRIRQYSDQRTPKTNTLHAVLVIEQFHVCNNDFGCLHIWLMVPKVCFLYRQIIIKYSNSQPR